MGSGYVIGCFRGPMYPFARRQSTHRHLGFSGSCAIVRGRPVPGRPGFRIEAETLAAKLRTAAVSIGRRQEGQRKMRGGRAIRLSTPARR